MSKRSSTASPAANDLRQQLLGSPMTFEGFRDKLGTRDKTNVERHLTLISGGPEPRHATVWQRLLAAMATLSPLPATTTGQQAISFFIADGKYRMQVFALEDNKDGKLLVYLQDILDAATGKAGPIGKAGRGALANTFPLNNDPEQSIGIEILDATNTPNPSPFYKHMLGWNRKALRITVPVDASDEQMHAVEHLLALAATKWIKKEPAV